MLKLIKNRSKYLIPLFVQLFVFTTSAQVFIPFSFWRKYVVPSITVFTSSNASWSVPTNWNNANNTIECIGGGGAGSVNGAAGGAGGGSGAYSKSFNTALTGGVDMLNIQIGTGGAGNGGDSSVMKIIGAVTIVLAKGGTAASAGTAGSGGASASGAGTVKNSGAAGGASSGKGAGGGAGAATANGVGRAGGAGHNSGGGGGGGGHGGASSTAGSGATGGTGVMVGLIIYQQATE